MTRNYIKAFSTRPATFVELKSAYDGHDMQRAIEEYWFFDDRDPVSISSAQQKSQAFKDRNPGCRIVFSVWRAIPGIRYFEVGAPRAEPKWRAA